jgi:hypothetical protein
MYSFIATFPEPQIGCPLRRVFPVLIFQDAEGIASSEVKRLSKCFTRVFLKLAAGRFNTPSLRIPRALSFMELR